jgi:tetratricopeptide (TPR) repeat protein
MIDLGQIQGSIHAAIENQLGEHAPPFDQLQQFSVPLILLDSLERIPEREQLVVLASIHQLLQLPQLRLLLSCHDDQVGLFLPLIGSITIYRLEPFSHTQTQALLARHSAPALLGSISAELLTLVRQPRWMAALIQSGLLQRSPYIRGQFLATLVATLLRERGGDQAAAEAFATLPDIAAAFDRVGREILPLADLPNQAAIRLCCEVGVLHLEQATPTSPARQVRWRHPILHQLARALGLARQPIASWPAEVLRHSWREALALTYGLIQQRQPILEWLLRQQAAEAMVSCLSEVGGLDHTEQQLAPLGPLPIGFSLRLADAFQQVGALDAAMQQLNHAQQRGDTSHELFRRQEALARQRNDWRQVRLAATQMLLRDADDIYARLHMGMACAHIGELSEAEAALTTTLSSLRRMQAEAAATLGDVYEQQGRLELALASYQQAVASQPGMAPYHRRMAAALHRLGRSAAAEEILRDLIATHQRQEIPPHDQIADYLTLGHLYAETGRADQALFCLNHAASLQPHDPTLLAQIGRLRRHQGDYAGAQAALQRAAQLLIQAPHHTNQQLAALQIDIGETALAIGDIPAALQAYREALQYDPQQTNAQRQLARLLGANGAADEGIRILTQALTTYHQDASLHADLAELLCKVGQYDQAIGAYRQAIALDPDQAAYLLGLGLTLYEQGNAAEAQQLISQAIERMPERADLHAAIGAQALRHQQWQRALQAYQQAAALQPHQAEYLRALAQASYQLGQIRHARHFLARAILADRHAIATWQAVGQLHMLTGGWLQAIRAFQRTGPTPPAREQIALAYAADGQSMNALGAFAQALQHSPLSPPALVEYSRLLAKHGQLTRAYEVARQALEQIGGQADLLEQTGLIAGRLDRPHEALALLDQALALDPQRPHAHAERSRILLGQNQAQAALQAARQALTLQPSHVPALLAAGQALIQLNQVEQARAALEQLLTIDPSHVEAHAALRDLLFWRDPPIARHAAQQAVAYAPTDYQHHLRLAAIYAAAQEHPAAIELLEGVLSASRMHSPEFVAACHAQLSQSQQQLGNWSAAQQHANQARSLHPQIPSYTTLLAEALAGSGEQERALQLLDQALGQNQDQAEWWYLRGRLRLQAGSEQGVADLRTALQIDPQHAHAHHTLGSHFAQIQAYAAATESLSRAVQIAPHQAMWHADLADVLIARGWDLEALSEVEHGLRIAPQQLRLLRQRASIQRRLGRLEQAQSDLVAVLRRDPDDRESLQLYTRTMLERQQPQAALGAARRAASKYPNDPAIRRDLVQTLEQLGRQSEAAEQQRMIAEQTETAHDWATLAELHLAAEQPDQARQAWARAAAAEDASIDLHLRHATFLLNRREPAAARAVLAPFLEQYRDHARVQQTYALILACLANPADWEIALRCARRAAMLAPDQPEAILALAWILATTGSPEEALALLQPARERFPNQVLLHALVGLLALPQQPALAQAAFEQAEHYQFDPAWAAGVAQAARAPLGLPSNPLSIAQRTATPAAHDLLDHAEHAIKRALAATPDGHPFWPRWQYEAALINQLQGHPQLALTSLNAIPAQLPTIPVATSWAELIQQAIGQAPDIQAIALRQALALAMLDRQAEAIALLEPFMHQQPLPIAVAEVRGSIALQSKAARDLVLAEQLLDYAAATEQPDWTVLQALGQARLANGQALNALAPLEQAVELQPDQANLIGLLADAYAAAGRREAAMNAALRATRLEPRQAEHHQRLASRYADQGRLQDARASLLNALSLQPDVPAWHIQMAQICTGLGLRDTAQAAIKRAIDIAPDDPAHRFELARALADQGQHAAARKTMEEVVNQDPEHGQWRRELARIYQAQNEPFLAMQQFQASIQYDPDQPESWIELAALQRQHHSGEQALETLERALERFGDHASIHAAIGDSYAAQDKQNIALWHYQRAIEAEPTAGMNQSEVWARIGALMLKQDHTQALAAVEQALQINEREASAHAIKAHILAKNGHLQSALFHGRTAVALNPGDPTTLTWVAEALLTLKRANEAYQLLARAVDRRSTNPDLLALLGDAASGAGRDDTALSAYERASELRPDDATLHFRIGMCHRRQKRWRPAISALRKAIKLRPDYGEALREMSTLGPLAFYTHYVDPDRPPQPPESGMRIDDLPPYERPDRRS